MIERTNEIGTREAALRESYIRLLKDALTMTLWDAGDGSLARPPKGKLRRRAKKFVQGIFGGVKAPAPDGRTLREGGRDWPRLAHTMIGVQRMNNLQFCVESVLKAGVPGDLIETGVWRGGACIFMRGILKAYGVSDRTVWVADSFAGLPPPNASKYPADAGGKLHTLAPLAVDQPAVQANFERYGLMDEQVRFLKGWFKDTLPNAPIQRLAVVRLDGDMYESTMDGLTCLYPKLSPGGYLIVDDYGALRRCRQAVGDYRQAQGITDPIQPIDGIGVFWQRSG